MDTYINTRLAIIDRNTMSPEGKKKKTNIDDDDGILKKKKKSA